MATTSYASELWNLRWSGVDLKGGLLLVRETAEDERSDVKALLPHEYPE